jgi:DNA ligase (NAD+)
MDKVEKLRKAARAYFVGVPFMSDMEFDTLEASIRAEDPDHPVLKEVGAPPSGGWPKVDLPFVVGSLNKAQSLAEIMTWITRKTPSNSNYLLATPKLDGISITLEYADGKLQRAMTRGDGRVGEDITRNVRIMEGVPETVPTRESFWARGEVVCRRSMLKKHFSGYANPRNTASGVAKRQNKGWRDCQYLSVMIYEIKTMNASGMVAGWESKADMMSAIHALGFNTPSNWARIKPQEIGGCIARFEKERDGLDVDTDGVVIEWDALSARAEVGEDPQGMLPYWAVAYKYAHDQAETYLREILFQTGPSGRVTPVAVFDPVPLAGASVSRASLATYGEVSRITGAVGESQFRVGDMIKVSRRNDVIPKVEELLEKGEGLDIHMATHCDSCHEALVSNGEWMICPNTKGCPAQVAGRIHQWVSKIGVVNFGEGLVNALVSQCWVKSIPDLYNLNEDKLAGLSFTDDSGGIRVLGGNAKRAMEGLHAKKDLDIATFLGSLGIPMCGRRVFQMVVEAGHDNLEKIRSLSVSDVKAIPGFGEERASVLVQGIKENLDLIDAIQAAGVRIKSRGIPVYVDSSMSGVKVCFSGIRDAALEEDIRMRGGSIVSGVSKDTSYLVVKDPSAGSAKIMKAQALGVDVVTIHEMRTRVGT